MEKRKSDKSPIVNGGRAVSQAFQTMIRNSDHKVVPHNSSVLKFSSWCPTATQDSYAAQNKSAPSDLGILQSMVVTRSPRVSKEQPSSELCLISPQKNQMEQMHQQLLRVESERDSAVRSNEHLRECLCTHRQTLERTLAQTQRALQEQYCLLEKQDAVIQGCLQDSKKNSAILDFACMVVSVYFVQTPLFKYTITLITAGGPKKSPQWWKYFWVLQLYAVMKFALKKSKLASRFGSGISWLLSNVWQQIKSLSFHSSSIQSSSLSDEIQVKPMSLL